MSQMLQLMRIAAEAITYEQFKIKFDWRNTEFDTNNITLLLHMRSFQHLSIGDLVRYNRSFWQFCPDTANTIKKYKPGKDCPVVIGFVKLTSLKKIKTKQNKIEHIFCILTSIKADVPNIIVSDTIQENCQTLLFWPESLEVKEKAFIK